MTRHAFDPSYATGVGQPQRCVVCGLAKLHPVHQPARKKGSA